MSLLYSMAMAVLVIAQAMVMATALAAASMQGMRGVQETRVQLDVLCSPCAIQQSAPAQLLPEVINLIICHAIVLVAESAMPDQR
ncbi:hypothetical protein JB92DRAFT_2007218 [Gautieria morchelliformis]|nr:hypothetical protein JB92DRAFT_2007218 [Gautieria morchelliformis]